MLVKGTRRVTRKPTGEHARTSPDIPEPRAWEFVKLRLTGKTLGECATLLRCDAKTLWEWRAKWDLDAIVDQLHADSLESLVIDRTEVGKLAMQRLKDMLRSPDPEQWQYAIDKVFGVPAQSPGARPKEASPALAPPAVNRDELLRRARRASLARSSEPRD